MAALGLASGKSARAGSAQDFVFCYPGKPGNQQAAKNVMDTFAEYVAKRSGFDVKSFQASYFNEKKPAVEFVQNKKPSFGILSVGLYLKWRKQGHKLAIIAQSERRGQMTEQYHVYVPAGSARHSLADLKGGVVVSDHLQDDAFATRVVFAGALDAARDVAIVSTRDPLRALKLCAKKKPMADGRTIDAVVLDDDQVVGMKDLPDLKALERVWSSRPLPTPPVVSFSENASEEDAGKLAAALLGMAKDDEGKRILESLLATGFNPVAPTAYAQVEKDY